MKIGIVPVNVGVPRPDRIVGLVRKAEELGFESVWTFEHAMVPVDYASRYPYSAEGKMGAAPETPFFDPFVTLAYLAASTQKIRLGTGVNILPQANPLYFAKQAASLDVLSGGRLLLGVGAGWLEEEYRALGVPFARRGARFDDYLTAIKKVWSGEVVEHQSEFLSLHHFKSYPLPKQKPHPPIIIGGDSHAALTRVVVHGDGWFAPTASAAQLAPKLGELRALAAKAGRDMASIEVTALWPYSIEGIGSLAAYRELGVSRLIVPLIALGERSPLIGMEKLAEALANTLANNEAKASS